MKIIGIGNALVDILAFIDDDSVLNELNLQRGGMELIDDSRQQQITELLHTLNPEMATGGSAGNTMLALANLQAHPGFIGRIGDDEMGRFFVDNCKKKGIDAHVIVGKGVSGVANTFISKDGERTFATHLGEAAKFLAEDVCESVLEGYDLLHIEGYLVQNHELISKVAAMAKRRGMKISIDLASYNVVKDDLDFFRHLVQEYVDIVFANEEESEAFTSGKNPDEALHEIAEMCEVAVVKLGKRGSSAQRGGEVCYAEGCTVNVIDTTAAGDFFAGGFLYAYSKGWPLKKCLAAGALLSSKVIQVVGTQVSDETWKDINERISVI